MALYAAHLYNSKLLVGTIRAKLTAIGWHHKINNHPDPTKDFLITRLLMGIKKAQATPVHQVAPLSHNILMVVVDSLMGFAKNPYLHAMLRAAFLLAYHGALRVGEFAKSTHTNHTLSIDNVSFLHSTHGTSVSIRLHSFKHSNIGASFIIDQQRSAKHCPVQALKNYLKLRPICGGPLFISLDKRPLDRKLIAKALKATLSLNGYNPDSYNTHSFRVGKASDMAIAGVPEAVIRKAGRWTTDAFKQYIRWSIFTMPTTN